MIRPALVGLLVALTVLCSAGPALAHATFVGSDPSEGEVVATAPEQATLTFDEPVQLPDNAVHLFDAAGQELPVEARSVDSEVVVSLPDGLEDGTYVVSWRVVSTDAHPITGSLTFSIGAPSTQVAQSPQDQSSDAVTAVQGIIQGLLYLGVFVSTGLALFHVLFLPTGRDLDRFRQRLRATVAGAGGAAVVAALLLLPITALYQQGLGLSALSTGAVWTQQATSEVGLVALLILTGVTVAVAGLGRSAPTAGRRWMVFTGVAVALGSLSLVGHTRSYGPVPLVMATDVVHVLAGAVWFGGLLGVGLSLRRLADREKDAAAMLARFSTVAAGTLVILTVAGTILAWRILGSWAALVQTQFGLVFLTKLGVVALAVAVAGWNRYRLLPRIAPGGVAARSSRRMLNAAVRGEAALLVIVLLLTGFLVDRTPETTDQTSAGAATGSPDTMRATADEIQVVAHVHPRSVGRNTIEVRLEDSNGEPIEPYAEPVVSLQSPEADVDLGAQPITNVDSSTYRLHAVIPASGGWEIEVSVRTSKFDNPVAVLEMTVPG